MLVILKEGYACSSISGSSSCSIERERDRGLCLVILKEGYACSSISGSSSCNIERERYRGLC